jgi:hypothetical protein
MFRDFQEASTSNLIFIIIIIILFYSKGIIKEVFPILNLNESENGRPIGKTSKHNVGSGHLAEESA